MSIDATEMNQRLIEIAENPDSRLWSTAYPALSTPGRVFRAVWEFEAEVNNGGFHQYFLNSAGRHANDAVASLHTIGAAATAGIVESAIKTVGYDTTKPDDARKAAVAALAPDIQAKLDELDQAFYAYPDNLTALLYKFVSEHADEMAVPEEFYMHSDALRERIATREARASAGSIRRPYFLVVIAIMILIVLASLSWLP